MRELKKYLSENPISLSRFINLCLYNKKYGFYQKNRIGRHFITAPEVSQLFGECVSIFLLMLREHLKIDNICELGPGNGTMMRDVISTMSKFINDDLFFYLHDKSKFLKSIQYRNLNKLNSSKIKINFLPNFKLKKQPYLFLCNEFFDALPINQYEKKDDIWFEKRVIFKKKFKIVNNKTNKKFSTTFNNGDIQEISPLSDLYLKKIFKHIKNFGGGVLIFDYGPFKKKRINTLQAIYKSKSCGIFDKPFESDITYHVDFENIKRISKSFNLVYYGPITQRKFLFFNGINERVISLMSKMKSNKEKKNLESQYERLILPTGMGSLIKCIFVSNREFNLHAFNSNE